MCDMCVPHGIRNRAPSTRLSAEELEWLEWTSENQVRGVKLAPLPQHQGVLLEFFLAISAVEQDVSDFDLRSEAVARLKRAAADVIALYEEEA